MTGNILFYGGIISCLLAELYLGILRNCLYQDLYSKRKSSIIKEFGYKGVRARRAYRKGKLIGVKDERGEVHSCKIQLFSGALHSV